MHQIAFKCSNAIASLGDMEDRIFKSSLPDSFSERPIFITGLPRAGTTTLLNLLVDSGAFASHIYKDMPFVLAPLLWHKCRSRLKTTDVLQERAHGDGIKVGINSAEALEEMIWMQFWREHYKQNRITPWHDCDDEAFIDFFRKHMAKIVFLRSNGAGSRYISKNNLNIARVSSLPVVIPDCTLLIPFRAPLQQASSLLKQHLQFLEMHQGDKFAKNYMAGVGHFDFGDNLRPVNFDTWMDTSQWTDPTTLSFWLAYWIAAYEHVLKNQNDGVHIVSYGALTLNPVHSLQRLAELVELDEPVRLTQLKSKLRQPREYSIDATNICSGLLNQAVDLESRLQANAAF